MTNTRFVVVDYKKKFISVYESKRCLAIFEFDVEPTAELIEELRIDDYKEKA